MIHGLMLAAAIEAAEPNEAPQRATESFGKSGSVVLGDIVAARAIAPYAGLGGAGTLTAGWLAFSSTRSGEASVRSVSAEPSFDVFVGSGVSIGALLGGGITSYEMPTGGATTRMEQWHLTAMPRIGEAFDLTKEIALWPRFAAGVSLSDSPGQDHLGTAFRATFDVAFVFRFSRHVFLQTGPQLSYFNQLSGPPDVKGFTGGASAGLSLLL